MFFHRFGLARLSSPSPRKPVVPFAQEFGPHDPDKAKVQELDVAALDDFEARFFVEPPERFGIQITINVTDLLVQSPTKLDDPAE
jgi:hypothetical protein